MRDLRGKTALVTGGAGGIGSALIDGLLQQGMVVCASDRPQAAEAQVLQETRAGVHWVGIDLTEPDAAEKLHGKTQAAVGDVQLVINNAGLTALGRVDELQRQEIERLVQVNFLAVAQICRVFVPELRRQKRAQIVNISSMAGYAGIPMQSIYCATKFAVRGFSESLRAELSGSAVGVTCITPGVIRTPILANATGRNQAVLSRLAHLQQSYALPADKAAAQIIRALRANRAEVAINPESYLLARFKRFAPTLTRLAMAGIGRAGVFT